MGALVEEGREKGRRGGGGVEAVREGYGEALRMAKRHLAYGAVFTICEELGDWKQLKALMVRLLQGSVSCRLLPTSAVFCRFLPNIAEFCRLLPNCVVFG